ncbi:hypothetical protein [Alteromonas ponticola]|uniref:Uncharacterized protein n=1 Tax=Alteromonas ponticola TaxID=2720613 RepID=A0ABX1R3G9_9ALTE|nr:hypothetical protein [Alteromonas ponticola]NMH60990.1 hypothetical protein [Alteromonas ponticola]
MRVQSQASGEAKALNLRTVEDACALTGLSCLAVSRNGHIRAIEYDICRILR